MALPGIGRFCTAPAAVGITATAAVAIGAADPTGAMTGLLSGASALFSAGVAVAGHRADRKAGRQTCLRPSLGRRPAIPPANQAEGCPVHLRRDE